MVKHTRRSSKHYINNKDFLAAMIEYRNLVIAAEKAGVPPPPISRYIGKCIYDITERLKYRYNFINYSYRDEMVSDGVENIIMALNGFDPEKSGNPFGYFTTIAFNAFVRRIQKEQKQLYIKHKLMENHMSTDTAVERGEHGTSGDLTHDLTTDYMNDFVSKYEAAMKAKKDKHKEKGEKKGLELFIDEEGLENVTSNN